MLNELYHFATPWAKATKRQINVNRMLGVAANALYPIYCAWSPLPKQRTTQGERMVVSLTTFPLRIGKVHLTIQSILRQSRPADRILLWLSKEEFPEEAQLPANLLRLKEKGLDIRFCDNIRSFKKVFYTAQEFENDVIVTADDDALYPENWLEGLNEGDYAMIMGFPGSTERYLTQSEVKQRMNAVNQAMIDMRGVRLEVLRKYMDASDKTRIQYASKFAGSSNYWKNSIGMNKAIIDNDVLGAKAEIEKKYAAFAQGKPEYEGVVEKIDAIIEKSTPTLRQLYYTNEALRGAIEFGSTYLIMDNIKKALEEKNDSLLQASKKQLENAYDGIHNKDYDHEVDRAVAKAILPALAKALNADELPSFYQTINGEFKGDYNAYVDNIYDSSILSNRKNLDKFLAKPTVKAIEKDPATAYSRSKNEKLQELGKQYMELESGMELLHKAYIRGLGEMKQPVPSYPDANFTMRLTYGNVKSYSPRDAVHYDYYTTTDGILEKENPEDREFVVPAKLKELIQKKDFGRYAMADGTMPVCFLTTNDITGGNSGSPVINGEGQLIGTAFDGNWESLSGDINFNNDLQRCIALDIRYVLFILDKLGNCSHLIKEMNIIE